MTTSGALRSACYVGAVTHSRVSGPRHAFAYPVYMHLVDLDELAVSDRRLRLFGTARHRVVRFDGRDHFDGSGDVGAALRRVVSQAGEPWPGGRVEVLTHCRLFGFVFNPVSFWFCYDPSGALALVVCEVNNTFGDRHPYVLAVRAATRVGETRYRWSSKKLMHVSPFFPLDGSYTWDLEVPGPQARLRVDVTLRGERQFAASFLADRHPLTDGTIARLLVTYPAMTLKVVAAIHWEALKLRIKGAPFRSQPPYDPEAARHGVS